jgi:hypothetical protein
LIDHSRIAYQLLQPMGMIPDALITGGLLLDGDERVILEPRPSVWGEKVKPIGDVPAVRNVPTEGSILSAKLCALAVSHFPYYQPVHPRTSLNLPPD